MHEIVAHGAEGDRGAPVTPAPFHERTTAAADPVPAPPAHPVNAPAPARPPTRPAPDSRGRARGGQAQQPVPVAMYRRTRAGRVTLVLWNLLATLLLVLAVVVSAQWLHTEVLTVLSLIAAVLQVLRTLGTTGDRNGFDLDNDGITMAYTGRQFTLLWADIKGIEVDGAGGRTWITVRQHPHALPIRAWLLPRWIRREPDNGFRFRTDWTRPVSDTAELNSALRAHSARRAIPFSGTRPGG
ncbi:hypothetical protein [Streptomyces sp. NPDC060035]|uniref:hypothetical protein n=1 Tax=Streptomyces sp. NPDC060035 TaxID=3347044 RepID=UPI003675916C